MNTSFKKQLHACVAGVVLATGVAHAQEPQTVQAAEDQPSGNAGLDSVVVTAEKREVDLTEIPVAISAFTADKMETVGIETVTDMANFTPGLTHSFTNDRLTVRGVGRFTNTRATEGGVAIYLDGLYTSTASGLMRDDLYIDRFEVLRGPQGTLYGRNSVGGAVNLISKRPTNNFQGELRALIANYERTVVSGSISGPITDNIRFRIAGDKTDQRKGFWENISTQGTGTDEGMSENRSYFELQLEGELLDERLDWWIKYGFERWDSDGGGTTGRGTNTLGRYNNFSPATGLTPNLLYGYGDGQLPGNTDFWTIRSGDRTPVVQDLPHLVTHLTYHADDWDLKYVGGYSNYNYYSDGPANGLDRLAPFQVTSADFPTSIAPGASVTINPNMRNVVQQYVWWNSHEFNLASTYEGPIQYLAGVYAYNEGSNDYLANQYNPNQPQYANVRYLDGTAAPTGCPIVKDAPGSGGNVTCNSPLTLGTDTVTQTYGAYAQVDWQLTDELKAVGGLRYTLDKKEAYERGRILCFLTALCAAQNRADPTAAFDVSALVWNPAVVDPSVQGPTTTDAQGFRTRQLVQEWDDWTWTLGLDWQPTTDTLVYGKYTKGYKAGGFNTLTFSPKVTTEPESVYLYELGLKQTFDDTLQVNGALYLQDYRNMQIPLTALNTVTNANESRFENMPKSQIWGIELETTWNPVSTLQVTANYSYLDSEIKEACCYVDPQDPRAIEPEATPISPGATTQNIAGSQLPFATPHRFTANVNYTWDFDAGSLTPSASMVYKSETYYSVFNRFYNLGKEGTQFDARVIWRDAQDTYSIIGYVRNISDQTIVEGASASILAGTQLANGTRFLNRNWSVNPPRTYGVEFQYRF